MSAKDDVIEAVRGQLGGAEDNLYRFQAAFRRTTMEDMEKEYGQSGQKRSDLLKQAEEEVKRWKAALDYLK